MNRARFGFLVSPLDRLRLLGPLAQNLGVARFMFHVEHYRNRNNARLPRRNPDSVHESTIGSTWNISGTDSAAL